MKTIKPLIIALVIALAIYVTVTPIAIYHVAHKEQIKQITYELVEPGSELESLLLSNYSIEYVQQ